MANFWGMKKRSIYIAEYYQNDEKLLRDELLCFQTMLNRAQRLPAPEFKRVERRLRMFDPLLDEDPWVMGKVTEGEARGRLLAVRDSLLAAVNVRFPSLIGLAEARATQIEQWDVLNALLVQLLAAKDEQTAREMLEQFTAS